MSRTLTTQDFIDRAKIVHGDTYDYSSVEYTGSRYKVDIVCRKHGPFTQKANNHLNGNGCQRCAKVHSITTSEFIKKANVVHGDRYDYSMSECASYNHKITIKCKIHGVFYQNYENHLKGMGCRKCGSVAMKRKQRKTQEMFILDSRERHGSMYDYSLVRYKNQYSAVRIICSIHGEFSQSPSTHTNGSGCPDCATTTFDKSKDSNIYILISENGRLMKIGITGNIKRRLTELKVSTPFKFHLLELFDVKGVEARSIEKSLHDISVSASLSGFGGATEWFYYDANVVSIATGMLRCKLNS
ncbi:endonuclease [Vibrio phage K165]|nr:hypothetical protein MYOV022v2_p0038 [Vibrio phage 12E28.1]QZI90207.1 hypothetical protein MYOV021v2_p0038 [Vibrio phage 18E29.1]QZI90572.1 hypothetical protein MYOV023v1_p0025 [Vibrio phage 91E28.1a]QZI90678.1 hypothetical protein MYOV020v1_p0052 [Vibrio phage 98E28.6a]